MGTEIDFKKNMVKIDCNNKVLVSQSFYMLNFFDLHIYYTLLNIR